MMIVFDSHHLIFKLYNYSGRRAVMLVPTPHRARIILTVCDVEDRQKRSNGGRISTSDHLRKYPTRRSVLFSSASRRVVVALQHISHRNERFVWIYFKANGALFMSKYNNPHQMPNSHLYANGHSFNRHILLPFANAFVSLIVPVCRCDTGVANLRTPVLNGVSLAQWNSQQEAGVVAVVIFN